ncbi:hypothetical protein ABZV65_31010 [Streptomyces bauhiniae]|uniref:hypothetical protein n=1 Tax=Streptomyces bauhiniae TaxID=2340725 RepID=UPI0033B54F92
MHSGPLRGWTRQLELLARIVEEIGLLAADRRREEPLTIVRPGQPGATASSRPGSAPQQQPASQAPAPASAGGGHKQMAMAAMQRGMIRSG